MQPVTARLEGHRVNRVNWVTTNRVRVRIRVRAWSGHFWCDPVGPVRFAVTLRTAGLVTRLGPVWRSFFPQIANQIW